MAALAFELPAVFCYGAPVLGAMFGLLAVVYGGGALYGYVRRDLGDGPYPSPEDAQRDIEQLAEAHSALCHREEIGRSTEGRPLQAVRFRGAGRGSGNGVRPRLLVTAHIHAVEYIGSYVARALARRLADGYGRVSHVTELLDRADVWMVPLLNPDGAARIWRNGGWTRLGGSRFTANGVDPNRNFPFVPTPGRKGWNSGRDTPGSAYYRGPHPLSEPECAALVRLCEREQFCAAINFHSFGGVVFLPAVSGADSVKARTALAVFQGVFQARQRHLRYRPVPERSAAIVGQLDPFLLNAFGTVAVTVEVSRPRLHLLRPWNTFNVFWWANPADPEHWVENDADAAIHALAVLLDRTGGTPCAPVQPELARAVDGRQSTVASAVQTQES